jgi:hypothetical protein
MAEKPGSTGTGPASGSGMSRSGLQRSGPCQVTPGGLGNIFGGCNNIWTPFPVFPEKSYEKSIV